VFINNGVESLIRLLSDVVDHLCKEEGYNPVRVATHDLFDAAQYYLDPAVRFLEDADAATATELRRSYGIAGRTRYWRRLQQAVQVERLEFTPEGLADFLRSEERAFKHRVLRDREGNRTILQGRHP
jgi:DNA sulfur modification protein DndB